MSLGMAALTLDGDRGGLYPHVPRLLLGGSSTPPATLLQSWMGRSSTPM